MFPDIGYIMLLAEQARIERERWSKLTREQQEWELRIREVEALERIARRDTTIVNRVSIF